MKKAIVLMALFLSIGFVTTAYADNVKIEVIPGLLSKLSVDLGSGYRNLYAGEFRFFLNPNTADEYETISYCVDPFEYFRSGSVYDYEILSVADYDADPRRITNYMPLAAYYMNKYAVAFNGSLMTYSEKDTAGGLALAIWGKLYPTILVNSDQDGDIFKVYEAIIADAPSNLTEGFFVAFREALDDRRGKQDQLFRQVPEPATMMLLGIGLLGLGVVNRRKMKK